MLPYYPKLGAILPIGAGNMAILHHWTFMIVTFLSMGIRQREYSQRIPACVSFKV